MLSLFLAVVSVSCAAPSEHETIGGMFDGRLLPGAKILSTGCSQSPHNSIQSAIDAARDGDIVEVCPGTYNERLVISGKAITLRSRDGADVTTIDAQWLGRGL